MNEGTPTQATPTQPAQPDQPVPRRRKPAAVQVILPPGGIPTYPNSPHKKKFTALESWWEGDVRVIRHIY